MGDLKPCNQRWLGVLAILAMVISAAPLRAQQYDEKLLEGMKWRLVGPFRGGRVLAVEGIAGDPSTYYFGGVAGGVWKTTNGGVSWTPLFDKEPVSSIGSIAVAPSDPNVVYVGTGEACIRGNISFGDGVFKSVDGGKAWTHLGLKDSEHIGKVIVDPHNPDVVFVAALGHAYGSNAERGVFRSTDGGKSWQKVLYKDERTGAIDITFDPRNPHILFAALWEAHRTPWSLVSGGPGSGLYRSGDDGSTWKRLEGHGLPEGILGRIGVSVSGADSNRVYALIEAEKGGIYRSEDGGETWRLVNDDHRFRQRAWYFSHIFADPKSVETLYVLNTGLYRSTDGGKTFTILRAPHGDHHGLWIDPTNPERMINCNDGGATITIDGGKTWTREDNQPTAQFYHVATDDRFPYYLYGAQQDNSTVAIANRSREAFIGREDWYPAGGGESGFVVPYPPDPNIVYAGSYGGFMTRLDRVTGQEQDISPWPDQGLGHGAADLKHRFQWTYPILISPHDSNTLYAGAEAVFKSTDGGASWATISPDLTRNDKSKQQASGGPITKDNTSVEYYDTIFALAESPREKGLLWVGTDDGLVQLTRDGGQHWNNATPKGMPEWSLVSLIEPSPHDAGTAYVALDCHKLDDYRPYIFRTSDYGKTWKKISEGLPENAYVHAVREDPKRRGLLYAGTERGIYVSFDDGGHWQSLQLNLPMTPIHDLVVHGDDLAVATHGRSFWVLDDLSPLRQMSSQIAAADVLLFTPAAAYRLRGLGFVIPGGAGGQNPPTGAILYYALKAKPKEDIALEVLDSKGNLVRSYSSKEKKPEGEMEFPPGAERAERLPTETGLNRFVWDFRYEKPPEIPGQAFFGERPEGPLALPGAYQVKLTVAGKSYSASLELRIDPRVHPSAEDLEKQFDLARKIAGDESADHQAAIQIRDARGQLEALRKRLPTDAEGKKIGSAAEDLAKKMTGVEEKLMDVRSKSSEDPLNYPVLLDGKLLSLFGAVDSADSAPTKQSYEVFDDLHKQLEDLLGAWREIQDKDLAAFNELVRKQNIAAVSVPPAAVKGGSNQ